MLLSSFGFPFFLLFLVLLSWFGFLLPFCLFEYSSANMAHSSTYVRTVPERSRSRDDPMWQSRHPQQRGRQYDPRPEVPPAPRLRKVLVIVDLQSVRPLMNKAHDDVMDATTCDVLPSLSRMEEEPCSPTMSYSIPTVSNPSRCTTFSIASASTSGTPGIATYPRPPWTLGGKTILETRSLSAMKTDLLNYFMNIVLIGLKAKNSAFYFPITSDILRLTFSLISCA